LPDKSYSRGTIPAGFATVDQQAAEFQHRNGQPGLAYGVVADGRLVHARGLGERWLGGPEPDERTVFRIASMTKSFTAAAVLALRDDGMFTLDDPAEQYYPEFGRVPAASPGSPPVTIRQLLTMTAGFPSDDPWGDRQQGMPLADFAELLAGGGVRYAWAPGTRFEYSNLGYAVLGRVVAQVSGREYPEFVADRLLRPLGMTATGFEAPEFDPGELARGHRRGGSGWEELEFVPYGAFAPMGGVFSCVADLARWASGFAAAFPPGGGGEPGPHPLRRAARREMQLPQVSLGPPGLARFPGDPAITGPASYGLGLFVEEHPAWGRIVQHSGGYPGFGSNMRWHPVSGLGVIVLGNSTYSDANRLAARLLDTLLRERAADGVAVGAGVTLAPGGGPWQATSQAQQQVMGLLRSWDDGVASRLFSPNVAQDEPLRERQRALGVLRARIGEFGEDAERPPEYDTPAHCRWWLRGEHGVTAAEIRLNPLAQPQVQSLTLAVPPAPGSPLARALDSLLSLLNEDAPAWPPSLPLPATTDSGQLMRHFRMAAAWAGRCRLGALRGGNGESTAAIELDGETGRLLLGVSMDPAAPLLHQVDLLIQS
jgi:CubicO group peptidase (beta-lactamase class C family)